MSLSLSLMQYQDMADAIGEERLAAEFEGLDRNSQEFRDAVLRLLIDLRTKGLGQVR